MGSEITHRFSARPMDEGQNDTDIPTLTYDTRRRGVFKCIIHGGSPEPLVRIFIGDDEMTPDILKLQQNRTFSLEGTDEGLLWRNYTDSVHSQDFRLPSTADGKLLRCAGFVHAKKEMVNTSAILTVLGR